MKTEMSPFGETPEARAASEKVQLAEIAKRNGWHARLPFDLAMQIETPEETFEHYGIAVAQGVALLQNPTFVRLVKGYRDIIVSEGLSFKTKARLQAEELLDHAFMLATDPDVAPAVRMDSIKWHSRVAGLDPGKDGEGGGAGTGGGAGFTLKIVFDGTSAGRPAIVVGEERPAIDVTPEKG